MGKSLNKWQGIGNVGKPPEVKYTPSGKAVANFSMALSERFKDKEGNWQDRTEWVNIVLWDKLAEICGEYVKKGSKIYIEGRLVTRTYEKDGVKKWVTEVIGQELILLDGKPPTSEQAASTESEDAPF